MLICTSLVNSALGDGLRLPKLFSTRLVMATTSRTKGDKGCRPARAWGSKGHSLALSACSNPLLGGVQVE